MMQMMKTVERITFYSFDCDHYLVVPVAMCLGIQRTLVVAPILIILQGCEVTVFMLVKMCSAVRCFIDRCRPCARAFECQRGYHFSLLYCFGQRVV